MAVTLTGTDVYGNAVSRSTTTDANGDYLFNDLSPAAAAGYTVTASPPTGSVNGPAAPPSPVASGTFTRGGLSGSSAWSAVVLAGNTAGSGYHFPALRRPTLAGRVYIDRNNNGGYDAGTDTTIASATVRLRDAASQALLATATTDGAGLYAFTDLDPLTVYLLEQPMPVAPAGLVNGPVAAGLIGGVACASGCTVLADPAIAGTDRITAIDLGAGTDGSGFDFGELAATGISGTVFGDLDRDGAMSATPIDTRIAGVTVRLFDGNTCTGVPRATAVTDANGDFAFSNAPASRPYTVCETPPAGWGVATPVPGAGGVGSGPNAIAIASLPTTGSPGHRFGHLAGRLVAQVWVDADNDGVRQGGEAAVAGALVSVSGVDVTGASVTRAATSDSGGQIVFDGLLASGAGGYTLAVQSVPLVGGVTTLGGRSVAGASGTAQAAGGAGAVSAIAVSAGAISSGHGFARLLPASLSGRVFVDNDDDGLFNGSDLGLAAVSLSLSGTDDLGGAVSRSTSSAPDGSFGFDGLRPGTYTVTEPVQPVGTVDGRTGAGNAGGTATPTLTLPSAVSGIVLAPGVTASNHRFAERAASSGVSGRVVLDADGNGQADSAEVGVSGVTIGLSGTTVGGVAVSRTTTTDGTGAWSFANLAPGSYRIERSAPAAGRLPGRIVAGAAGGTASVTGTLPMALSNLALGTNQIAGGLTFLELPAARLAGLVFGDDDDDGQPGTTETGLPGVAIGLEGTDDLGAAVARSTVSGSDGRFAFEGLRPGSYSVVQTQQPAGTLDGTTTAGTGGGAATPRGTLPSAVRGIAITAGLDASGHRFAELASSPDLRVTATHAPQRLTVGRTGRLAVAVRNAGTLATQGAYTVDGRLPTGLVLDGVPNAAGWTCTGSAGSDGWSCSASTPLAPGASAAASIDVPVRATTVSGSPFAHRVRVQGGGEIGLRAPSTAEQAGFAAAGPLATCPAAPGANACLDAVVVQAAGSASGTVWHDVGPQPGRLDGGDVRLADWVVQAVVVGDGSVQGSTRSAADGSWRLEGLEPGVPLSIRFREPRSGVAFGTPVNGEGGNGSSGVACDPTAALASAGASSCPRRSTLPELQVVLAPGQQLTQQSLPVDPSGVVYDAGTRLPVAGATVALAPLGTCAGWNPSAHVVGAGAGGYAVQGDAVAMTVGPSGFYQFFFDPSAPATCEFRLSVTAPSGWQAPSRLIPPQTGVLRPSGGPTVTFAVQPQAGAPTGPVGPATAYWLTLAGGSQSAGIVHNHVALDAAPSGALALSKTGDRQQAEVGDTVRYTVTARVLEGSTPRQLTVLDRLPMGFSYVAGSASVDGRPVADPTALAPPRGAAGARLAFQLGAPVGSGPRVLQYRLRVGVGADRGDGVNRAQAHACGVPAGCVDSNGAPLSGSSSSAVASWRVAVQGGVFADEACVVGQVTASCNAQGRDGGPRLGVPGVALWLLDGTRIVTDAQGRYSACGLPPRSTLLRADPTTLPPGMAAALQGSRDLGVATTRWLDLKKGELHRADVPLHQCSPRAAADLRERLDRARTSDNPSDNPPGGAPPGVLPLPQTLLPARRLDSVRTAPEARDAAR